MSLVDRIRSYIRASSLSFREALLWGLVLAAISISVAAGISSPTKSAGDDASLDINAEEHKSGAEILTEPEETPLDGTGILDLVSSDSGDQVKFIFDWGDGTTSETDFVDSGVNVSESHSWSSEGVYYVKVMAEDTHGASSSWSEALEVRIEYLNTAPETPDRPDGPVIGYFLVPYSYSTSATDADGDRIKYIFKWGDGTTSETDYLDPGTSTTLSHKWIFPGVYYITAKAIDIDGETSGWSDAARILIYRPIKPS